MSRKNHGRGYGRQHSQDQENWQNRGNMQRNQYDNIGRDQYGSNSRQGSGYGSQDRDRGDEEGSRPNWPGEQNNRRYGSQNAGNDSGMGRYQGSQGFGDEYGRSRENRGYGNDPDYDNWGEGDSEFESRQQSSSRRPGQGQLDRDDRNIERGNRGNRDSWQGYENQSFGGSRDRTEKTGRAKGEHSGRGPKGYRRDDSRILDDINEELTQHSEIDASEIEVKVSNGEVTLTGTVDNREAKRMAEDCAEGVSGVTDVQNQIRVQKTVGAAREDEDSSNPRSKSGRSGSSSTSTTGSSSSESTKNRTGAGIGS